MHIALGVFNILFVQDIISNLPNNYIHNTCKRHDEYGGGYGFNK